MQTKLVCDSCGYTEYTSAPQIFRGDLCMECEEGYMTTPEMAKSIKEAERGHHMTIKFANAEDTNIIEQIVERVEALSNRRKNGFDFDSLTLGMDLSATHANGTPLRLSDMLRAKEFDLLHDVFGITRHIDRKTGKLKGFFLPRFAEQESHDEPRNQKIR